jgi:hypothetical protein
MLFDGCTPGPKAPKEKSKNPETFSMMQVFTHEFAFSH